MYGGLVNNPRCSMRICYTCEHHLHYMLWDTKNMILRRKKENHRSSRLVQLTESYCSLKNEWYKSHLRLFYKWMNEHIYSLPLFGLRKGKDYYNNHSKFPSIYSPIFYSILLTTVSSHRHNWRTKNEWVRQTSLHLIISFPCFLPTLLFQFIMMVQCR